METHHTLLLELVTTLNVYIVYSVTVDWFCPLVRHVTRRSGVRAGSMCQVEACCMHEYSTDVVLNHMKYILVVGV